MTCEVLPHECLNNPEYSLSKNNCIFTYLLSVCLYHSVYADARGQTVGMSSVLLSYRSQGSNSGRHAWRWAPLPTQPFDWPQNIILYPTLENRWT